jgi:CHASE2 domain-containing sensor protein
MPSSDPQPPAEPELAWLLHSALVWAVTGALMTMARRPLWSAVGVVLTMLGIGVAGWVVRRRLHQQPPRQPTNGSFRYLSTRAGHRGPPAPSRRAH